MIAPFAFLGPAYDETLRNVFASGEMANLLQSDGLAGLFGTGLFKTAPAAGADRAACGRHDAGRDRAEYRAGRRLYIVTTNLDAQRTAIWDMGKIAASGDPGALDLFRNVLTASASIPGVFSPVLIDVEATGTAVCGNARRWRRDDERADRSRGRAVVRHAAVFVRRASESLYRDERQAFARFRSRDGLDADDRDAFVRNVGARQHPQYAARVLSIHERPELGVQLGFDRSFLSEIRPRSSSIPPTCSNCSTTAINGDAVEYSGKRRRRNREAPPSRVAGR